MRLVVLLCLMIGMVGAFSRVPSPAKQVNSTRPLLPRAGLLKIAAAGHIQLTADYFWVQLLQATWYARSADGFLRVYDYAKLISEIDPQFRQLYMFAGAAIPVFVKGKGWQNTRESTDILERGLRAIPDHVMLRILLAYNLSTYENEPLRAAELLEETSKLPRAPPYLKQLATRLYAQGGDFDAALTFAQTLRNEAEDDETRETFELRTKQLLLERELKRVEAAAARFQSDHGRAPVGVNELVASGLLEPPPQDPFEGTIELSPEGVARSTAHDERLRVYRREDREE